MLLQLVRPAISNSLSQSRTKLPRLCPHPKMKQRQFSALLEARCHVYIGHSGRGLKKRSAQDMRKQELIERERPGAHPSNPTSAPRK